MKIQRLTIRNIASIEKADLDFTHGPLSEDSIVLITGETGSGKSTILNCICIALYNSVPALADLKLGSKTDSNNISVTSPLQLVRQGEEHACIKLEFIGTDGLCYEASWAPVYYQRGPEKGNINSNKAPERMLTRVKDQVSITRVNEFEQKILEIVGLTFEQFCRTTMLAQGQFLKFLTSDGKEKTQILEKMTGTGIYAEIGAQIFQIHKNHKEECDKLQVLYDANKPMAAEDLKALVDESNNIAEALKAAESSEKEAVAFVRWLEKQSKHQHDLAVAEAELKKWLAPEMVANIEACRKTLADWDDTAEIRAVLNETKKVVDNINAANDKISQKQREFGNFLSGLAFLQHKHDLISEKILQIEKEIESESANVGMYEAKGKIVAIIDAVIANIKKISDYQRKSQEAAVEKEKSEKELLGMRKELDTASDALKEVKQAVDDIAQDLSKIDLADLQRQSEKAYKDKEKISKAISLVTERNRIAKELSECMDKLEANVKMLGELETNLGACESAEKSLADECKLAEAKLNGMMDLQDKIAELTQVFSQDKKCPLCGSEVEHIHSKEIISEIVVGQQAQVAELRAKHADVLKALSDCKAAKKKQEADIKNDKIACERKEKEQKANQEECEMALGAIDAQIDDNSPLPQLNELFESQEKLIASLSEQIRQGNEITGAYRKAAAARDKAQKAYDDCKSRIDVKEQRCRELDAAIARDGAVVKEMQQSNARSIDELVEEFPISGPSSAPMLCRSVSKEIVLENLPKIKTDVIRLKQGYDNLLSSMTATQKEAEENDNKISATRLTLESVEAVCGKVDCHAAPKEMANIEESARNFVNEVHALTGKIDSLHSQKEKLKAAEDACLEGKDKKAVMASVESLALESAASIKDKRESVTEYNNHLSEAQGTVKALVDMLAELISERPAQMPEELTLQDAQAKHKEIADGIQELNVKKGSLKQQIDDDANRRKKVAAIEKELNDRRAIERKWGDICDFIGDATGEKFRGMAQSYVFIYLLQCANAYLKQLMPRYELEADYGNLLVYVVDHNDPLEKRRLANSLSGGEGFIASLALALALSSLNKNGVQVDTLFIDEGFGTLSSNVLNTVMDMLSRLQSETGRRVVIISHMEYLRDQIATQIQVNKVPGTTKSTISIK